MMSHFRVIYRTELNAPNFIAPIGIPSDLYTNHFVIIFNHYNNLYFTDLKTFMVMSQNICPVPFSVQSITNGRIAYLQFSLHCQPVQLPETGTAKAHFEALDASEPKKDT
jgi:hypothetical protein